MVTFHPGARPGSDGSTVSKTSLCVSDTPRSGLHVGTGPILTSENNSKTKQHSSWHDSKHLRIPINNATPSFPARHVPFDNRHTQAQAFCLKLAGGIHTNRPRFWGPLQPLSFFCGEHVAAGDTHRNLPHSHHPLFVSGGATLPASQSTPPYSTRFLCTCTWHTTPPNSPPSWHSSRTTRPSPTPSISFTATE